MKCKRHKIERCWNCAQDEQETKDFEMEARYPNHDPEKLGPWNEDEVEGEL